MRSGRWDLNSQRASPLPLRADVPLTDRFIRSSPLWLGRRIFPFISGDNYFSREADTSSRLWAENTITELLSGDKLRFLR